MKASSVEPTPAATVLHVQHARGFVERARGLLGRPAVAPGCGLLLQGVNAVHGFGMRRAIDLVFLDDRATVMRCLQLVPWRIARCAAASAVLEMRAGEADRLQLRAGSRLVLHPVTDIFRQPRPEIVGQRPAGEAGLAPPAACGGSKPRTRDRLHGMRAFHWMLASAAAALNPDAIATEAGSSAPPAAGAMPAYPRGQASEAPMLRRFEAEAEALYRESAPRTADAELVRLYEALATAVPRRRAHAWLRIGNIHQRAGAVGAAMDAYRKALDEAEADAHPTGAEDSRRKALLNLASLALDQARQALAGLPPGLPAAARHVEQLGALSHQLERSSPRAESRPQPQSPPAAAAPAATTRESTHVVDRYTASARRNAVKAAKGSLHVDPANELLARPLPRTRSRLLERPPDVEYLLGDPQRSQATARESGAKGAKK